MNISGIECLGIERVLKRGTGEILENTGKAILVRDIISNAFFLACEGAAVGIDLLDRHLGAGCNLLMVTDCALGQAAFEKYGFSDKFECYQFAYYGEKPSVDSGTRLA